MKKLLICLLLLVSCKSYPVVEMNKNTWTVPIVPESTKTIEKAIASAATPTVLPESMMTTTNKDKVEEVIIVGKTVITVKKKHVTPMQKLKNFLIPSPEHEVVANSPDVKVMMPETPFGTLLVRWLGLILAALVTLFFIVSYVYKKITSVSLFDIVKKLLFK